MRAGVYYEVPSTLSSLRLKRDTSSSSDLFSTRLSLPEEEAEEYMDDEARRLPGGLTSDLDGRSDVSFPGRLAPTPLSAPLVIERRKPP